MDNNAVNNDTKQYIMVKFDNEQYGIDIAYIDNIVRLQPITRVPHTQEYFLGIINLRGEIIPVMSLRRKFDLEDKDNTNSSRILIIKYEGNAKIGMLVDEVKEVVTLSDDDIEKISSESPDSNRGYLAGVGKYNDTLITLLNIGVIINDIDNDF
ncbi:MAG: purine-binding chemotaxis protein CheW [Lachnospiraceae bacterium]|nr:purine-binding chemotaxis protein CheW [Lachnospiraceae bacterium]MBQ8167331.1 purine-binding chemotaxis protein CheW [Lachnospiraceae bacterium]